MSIKMRLTRLGAKKKPFYRVIVCDSKSKRDGKYIEQIGYYNPMKEPPDINIDAEKAKTWIDRGVIPSDTVKNLLKKANISVT